MTKYFVDIDGVLTNETKGWDYENRTPNKENIKEINFLKDVTYFTSRHREDAEKTRRWMHNNGVDEYDGTIIFRKPRYDILIDDKALPAPMEKLDYYMNYNIDTTCWRYDNGTVDEGEEHDCFFCGDKIKIKIKQCEICRLIPCPSCKKCLCNVPVLSRITVIKIHEKYCCSLPSFKGDVALDGFVDMNVINNAKKTLTTCACLEKLL